MKTNDSTKPNGEYYGANINWDSKNFVYTSTHFPVSNLASVGEVIFIKPIAELSSQVNFRSTYLVLSNVNEFTMMGDL